MIQKKDIKFGKRYIAIAATAIALVLLIVSYLVINAILPGLLGGTDKDEPTPPEIIAGESLYGSMATIYPYIKPDSILAVKVTKNLKDGQTGEAVKDIYMMSRPEDGEGKPLDYFIFSYNDPKSEEMKVYYPDILYEDASFSYSDLYAVEQSTGLGARKIDYLCAAIGALYFDERIALSSDEKTKASELLRYGLSEEDREVISLMYLDENGKEQYHTVYVGNKLITGVGYYFMLAGRDYVYTSTASENLSYALGGFEAFIDARIIAAEGENDKGAAPYHTGRYDQWTSKYHTVIPGSGEILTVPAGVDIVINTDYIQPIYADIEGESEDAPGCGTGYRPSGSGNLTVSSSGALKELVSALVGMNVGSFSKSFVYTLVLGMNSAVLFDGESGKGVYEYTIKSIESIVTKDGDITETGTGIPEGGKIKVEYSYTLDGKAPSREICHAVIDLSKDSAIPEDIRSALQSASVGELSSPLTFEVKYNEDNAGDRKMTCVISDISLILEPNADGNGGSISDRITENSIVNFEYYYLLDGEKLGESSKRTVILSEIKEGSAEYSLKQALIGKTMEDRMFSVVTDIYTQAFMDFGTYEIKGIEGYISIEEIVRFCFVPEGMRDPFHAESIYKNTLPSNNKYSAYAMNNESCDEVLRILGGISGSSASVGAQGLVGTETVAVGLSHDTMVKYGLYDGHRIYFELPRNLASGGSDYTWLGKIGFTLYIGNEIQPDGSIYVASDMYDTVVKISPETFGFLGFSFPEYWARRNVALIDVADIEKISLKLNFDDLYGEYEFDLEHTPVYVVGDKGYYEKPEGFEGDPYDIISVTVNSLSDRRTDSLFSELISSTGSDFYGLTGIYNISGGASAGTDIMADSDTLGTSQLKELLRMIYSTYCIGVLDEDAQSKANPSNKLMVLEFDLGNKSDHTYRYEFYRIEDRRIMVSISKIDSDGRASSAVSDLYISELAFRKLVSGFDSLLNGRVIDPDKVY